MNEIYPRELAMKKHNLISSVCVVAVSLAIAGCGLIKPPVRENSPVCFTELHFNPTVDQGDSDAEFLEICNRSNAPVSLAGWDLAGVGQVEFPNNAELEAGEVLVFCKDVDAVKRLPAASVAKAAPFDGKLKNEGETITLTDLQGRIAAEISYSPSLEIVTQADGTGKSLQRKSLQSDLWHADTPTPGKI
jgi:hypothetical protein